MMRISQMIAKRKPAGHRRKVFPTAADLDCATAFQRIAQGCTAMITSHHGGACAGDAEAVHQLRVAITRLRAAASFFGPMAIDAEWLRLEKEIAWLNVSLGAARDSDVIVDYAGRKRYRAWAQGVIGHNLHERRMHDHRRLVRCLRSRRFKRLIEDLSDWVVRGPWVARWRKAARRKSAEPLKAYSEHMLARWHKRFIRKGRQFRSMDALHRHRLRIKAKRFRYMLEALRDIFPARDHGELRRMHRHIKRLQRVLGDLRDLKRFGRLSAISPHVDAAPGDRRPPGYRRRKEKLLEAAVAAYRSLKQAGVA
jgi:CHAD domain-containing protein